MSKFIRIAYLIHQSMSGSKPVKGYAFETPGWTEFHACVRFDRREDWSKKAWILDHYESGKALRQAGELKRMKDAPATLKLFLDGKGAECIARALANMGATS